jgi:hypothetical protein
MKINEVVYAAIEIVKARPGKVEVKLLSSEMVKSSTNKEWGVEIEINGKKTFLEYSLAADISMAPYGKKLADTMISSILNLDKPKKKKPNGKRKK